MLALHLRPGSGGGPVRRGAGFRAPSTAPIPNAEPSAPGTAVEREGPFFTARAPALAADVTPDAQATGREPRPTIFLVGLPETDTGGLGFLGAALRSTTPEVLVHEIDLANGQPVAEWTWKRSLLSARATDDVFTLEDGIWRRIVTFRFGGEELPHQDYATGAGFSLRFGDGVFGRIAAARNRLRGPLSPGTGDPRQRPRRRHQRLHRPRPPGEDHAPLRGGRQEPDRGRHRSGDGRVDPESAAQIKQLTPQAYQQERFFAVQPDDYGEQAERLDFVQRAQGTPRWTGSWLSMFVAADPFGAFALSTEQKAQLTAWMDCVRQTGREVIVKDPKPLSIDLEITICIEPFAYASQVLALVEELLIGSGGGRNTVAFFSPDNFTFGMPLRRSALEAAIQRVPGVRFVGQISDSPARRPRIRRAGRPHLQGRRRSGAAARRTIPSVPTRGRCAHRARRRLMSICPCDQLVTPQLDIPAGLDALPRQIRCLPRGAAARCWRPSRNSRRCASGGPATVETWG